MMTGKISDQVPAIPYMAVLKKYAQEKGYKFFTWYDQCQVALKYNQDASLLN